MTPSRRGRWARRPTAQRGHGRVAARRQASPSRPWLGRRPTRDGGSATAELAASLPALMLMLFIALTAIASVRTQLQCVDAAREAARAQARGEPGAVAGDRVAPSGAVVGVVVEGDLVRATVSVRVHPLGGRLPGFAVTADATALIEPGATGG